MRVEHYYYSDSSSLYLPSFFYFFICLFCLLGVPPRMRLNDSDIQFQLDRRRPGQSLLTTARNEKDRIKIVSGTEVKKKRDTTITNQYIHTHIHKHSIYIYFNRELN